MYYENVHDSFEKCSMDIKERLNVHMKTAQHVFGKKKRKDNQKRQK